DLEEMHQNPIISVSPKMAAAGSVDQLRSHTYAGVHLADAAFQHIPDPKLATDLLNVDGAAFVGERAVASDDEQRLEARQGCDDVFHNAVREVLLFGIAAHVLEGEHSDGGPVG